MNTLAPSDTNRMKDTFRDNAAFFTQQCADLTSIYEDHIGLCVWTPPTCKERQQYALALASQEFHFKQVIEVEDIFSSLDALPSGTGKLSMQQWIGHLIEMYATLFGLEQVGVRIAGLKRPMCPRFHVDHVPTRLIHSLYGDGCNWFQSSEYFNPDKKSEHKLSDWLKQAESSDTRSIRQAPAGAVVIMKGTKWGEDSLPVIHRSPQHDQPRLVLTLDFA
ncbi:MAG: DUF1826 domain-containing protein [Zetaproteobacteria bacterium]|nr:DUF1826 domain-containing protein [Zetaproteobacteria bacterium]